VTHTDLLRLQEIEENILRYGVHSDDHLNEIQRYFITDDFTFFIHQRIFKYLPRIKELKSEILVNKDKYLLSIEGFDCYIFLGEDGRIFDRIDPDSVFEMLSKPYSKEIQKDIELLKERALKIENTRRSGKEEKELFIDTKNSSTWAYFRDDMLVKIKRTSTFLPPELQGSFKETLKAVIDSEQKDNDSKIEMTLHGYSEDPEIINSVVFIKEYQ
jgi:hypothetical protein